MDATWAGSNTCQTLQIPMLPWQPLKFLQLMQRGKAGAIGDSWRPVQHGTPPVPIWRWLRRKKNSSLRHQPPSKAPGNTLGNALGNGQGDTPGNTAVNTEGNTEGNRMGNIVSPWLTLPCVINKKLIQPQARQEQLNYRSNQVLPAPPPAPQGQKAPAGQANQKQPRRPPINKPLSKDNLKTVP
jgi:hypothetical protein